MYNNNSHINTCLGLFQITVHFGLEGNILNKTELIVLTIKRIR